MGLLLEKLEHKEEKWPLDEKEKQRKIVEEMEKERFEDKEKFNKILEGLGN